MNTTKTNSIADRATTLAEQLRVLQTAAQVLADDAKAENHEDALDYVFAAASADAAAKAYERLTANVEVESEAG